jgi:hypothetical protein
MKAYRIYTTVFVVNERQELVVKVECPHTEAAIDYITKLNAEFRE